MLFAVTVAWFIVINNSGGRQCSQAMNQLTEFVSEIYQNKSCLRAGFILWKNLSIAWLPSLSRSSRLLLLLWSRRHSTNHTMIKEFPKNQSSLFVPAWFFLLIHSYPIPQWSFVPSVDSLLLETLDPKRGLGIFVNPLVFESTPALPFSKVASADLRNWSPTN